MLRNVLLEKREGFDYQAEAFTPEERPSCPVCALGNGNLGVRRVAGAVMFSFFIEKAKVHKVAKTLTTKMIFPRNRVPMLGEGKPESAACCKNGLQFYSNASSHT